MITGEGTPLNLLQSGAQSVRDLAQNATFISRDNPSAQKDSSGKTDIIELSKEARNFLNNSRNLMKELAGGQQELARSEREFIGQRLEQLREQIQFLKKMISVATPGQAGTIMKGLEDAASTLEKIGQQLGIVDNKPAILQEVKNGEERVEVSAMTLTASFNQIAIYENQNGEKYSVAQSLDIEFSFLEIKATGVQSEIEQQAVTQKSFADMAENNPGNPLFLAQLNQNQASARAAGRAASVSNSTIFEELSFLENDVTTSDTIEKFSETLHGLTETIKEFGEVFTDEERMPPSLYRIMKNMLTSTLENMTRKDDTEKVDQIA